MRFDVVVRPDVTVRFDPDERLDVAARFDVAVRFEAPTVVRVAIPGRRVATFVTVGDVRLCDCTVVVRDVRFERPITRVRGRDSTGAETTTGSGETTG